MRRSCVVCEKGGYLGLLGTYDRFSEFMALLWEINEKWYFLHK